MPLRTKLFSLFPWVGGVNTALDPSTIPSNQLIQADDVIFGTRGSRRKREGINHAWDSASNGSTSLIGLHDFWFGATTKSQRLVAIASDKAAYSYTTGTRATISGGTAWASTITNVSMATMNNLCVIAVDGTGNIMKKWSGSGNIADLLGTPPVASICREYRGRLWTNDKTNCDRLHYSTIANCEEWNGVGDSGAIDIGVGDGDPDGITAIFPGFKDTLFVAKRTKLYRIDGDTPENFSVRLVSNGVGCVSHNSCATVDQDDIVFMSERGIHSLMATANFGDFEGAYLSADIQTTFNENFKKSRRKYTWAAYLSEINSVAFAVTDTDYSDTVNKAIWLYNLPLKSWYRWPNIVCQSLIVANDSDRKRFYFGTATTRVSQALAGTNYDTLASAAFGAVEGFTLKTGVIFPEEDPFTVKYFKRFVLYYKPIGTNTVTVNLRIDNAPTQSVAYQEETSGDLLGTTFILGASVLGSSHTMQPYTRSIDGAGRGIQVTIVEDGIDGPLEIQGFGLEYESGASSPEVLESE